MLAAAADGPSKATPSGSTFRAVADAHVIATARSRNFGSGRLLRIGPRTRAYIRFRVAGVRAPISAATLRLYVLRGGGRASVHPVAVKNWRERRITYGAAPALGRVVRTAAVPRRGQWASFDVTPVVRTAGIFSVGISSTRPIVVSSRESGRSPQLVVSGSGEPGEEATMLAAGDVADCGSQGDEATARLLDRLPGTIAVLGDVAYPDGRPQDFRCYDASWGKFKARTRPAVGNHEYLTPNASGYFDYFGAAAGDRTKGYYSYGLGRWHVAVINSNCSRVGGCQRGSAQERWLRADLAASTARCTVAYWHHPLFSSGDHGAHTQMRFIWDALYDAGAELVLVGHDHMYERFAPQTSAGQADAARGIREFMVGTGGKNHTRIRRPQPNSEVRNDSTFGILQLTLRPTSYTWRFVPEAGKTFTDAGSGVCH
jgi:acid phosphatase type 7